MTPIDWLADHSFIGLAFGLMILAGIVMFGLETRRG